MQKAKTLYNNFHACILLDETRERAQNKGGRKEIAAVPSSIKHVNVSTLNDHTEHMRGRIWAYKILIESPKNILQLSFSHCSKINKENGLKTLMKARGRSCSSEFADWAYKL